MKAQLLSGALVFLVLLPVLAPALPVPPEKRAAVEINELVRRAAANFKKREDLRNDYMYLAHFVWSSFDPRRRRPKPSTADFEIVFLGGEPYMRQIKSNDQPLSPEAEEREIGVMEAFAKARREAKRRPGGLPA